MLETCRVFKNENPELHLTGEVDKDYVSDKLSPVDCRVLGEIVTPVVESAFNKEECLGGVLVVGSVASKEKRKYNDVDLLVILDDPKKDSERIVDRLEREFEDCNRLKTFISKDFVPSPTGGEFVTSFFTYEPRTLVGKSLPLMKSSIFEIRVCALCNYPYDDYLSWLAENNISHCLWLKKTG